MNCELALDAISNILSTMDPSTAYHWIIVWCDKFEILPHDGKTHLYPNEFAIISRREVTHGITIKKWNLIKHKIEAYFKDHPLCQGHQKP